MFFFCQQTPRLGMMCLGNRKFSQVSSELMILTADAEMKLVRVLLSDGSTFPATTSSEPLKYLSKRFWVMSDTESSGN